MPRRTTVVPPNLCSTLLLLSLLAESVNRNKSHPTLNRVYPITQGQLENLLSIYYTIHDKEATLYIQSDETNLKIHNVHNVELMIDD